MLRGCGRGFDNGGVGGCDGGVRSDGDSGTDGGHYDGGGRSFGDDGDGSNGDADIQNLQSLKFQSQKHK